MRDVKRIDTFCDELKGIWKEIPDWRFTQLMMNFFSYSFKNGVDPFFMEEGKSIEMIKKYVNEMIGGES